MSALTFVLIKINISLSVEKGRSGKWKREILWRHRTRTLLHKMKTFANNCHKSLRSRNNYFHMLLTNHFFILKAYKFFVFIMIILKSQTARTLAPCFLLLSAVYLFQMISKRLKLRTFFVALLQRSFLFCEIDLCEKSSRKRLCFALLSLAKYNTWNICFRSPNH